MKLLIILTLFGFAFCGCGGDEEDARNDYPESEDIWDDDDNFPVGSGDSDVCERLIDCMRAVDAGGITAVIGTYGEDGTCWSMSGVEDSDCWTECRAAMEPYRLDNPEEPACRECEKASQCAALGNRYCDLEGECSDSICGNGELEGDEVCDDPLDSDCNSDCTHELFECNPLNDSGTCERGERCDLIDTYDGIIGECTDAGHASQAEECDDSLCDAGYACIIGSRVRQCPNGGPMCCTEWCDLSSEENTCPDGLECYTFAAVFEPGSSANIMNIGYCGSSD